MAEKKLFRLPSKEDALKNLEARQMSFVHVGEERNEPADIYYKIYGKKEHEPVILVMGFLGRGEVWKLQVDFLVKNQYQVLILDNRGTGQSSVTTGRYTTKMMAKDAYEVIQHLQWTKFHIIGCSMGGMISQELALMSLNSVLTLSLLSTHAGGITSVPPLKTALTMLKNMFVSDLEQNQHNSMKLLYNEDLCHKNKELYDELHARGVDSKVTYGVAPFQTFMSQLMAITTHRVEEERFLLLREANIPVLVLTGNADTMVRPENSIRIAKMLNVKPVVWNDAGHHM